VRGLVENLRSGRLADTLQQFAALAGFRGKEAAEAEGVGGKPAGYQGREERRGEGNDPQETPALMLDLLLNRLVELLGLDFLVFGHLVLLPKTAVSYLGGAS
jgi:hypothetical protein